MVHSPIWLFIYLLCLCFSYSNMRENTWLIQLAKSQSFLVSIFMDFISCSLFLLQNLEIEVMVSNCLDIYYYLLFTFKDAVLQQKKNCNFCGMHWLEIHFKFERESHWEKKKSKLASQFWDLLFLSQQGYNFKGKGIWTSVIQKFNLLMCLYNPSRNC